MTEVGYQKQKNPLSSHLTTPLGIPDQPEPDERLAGAGSPASVRILNSIGQVADRLTIPATGVLWNAAEQPDGIYFIQSIPSES